MQDISLKDTDTFGFRLFLANKTIIFRRLLRDNGDNSWLLSIINYGTSSCTITHRGYTSLYKKG
jgi:hypothetical protein